MQNSKDKGLSKSKSPFRGQGFDFVFLGAGLASLSLLMRMIRSGHFNDKQILLVDKEPKTKNDRTWCFWETSPGFFDSIVHYRWDSVAFLSEEFSEQLSINPYQYKMIRGIDLYNYCFTEIAKHANIQTLYAEIGNIEKNNDGIAVTLNGEKHSLGNALVFNSIYTPAPANKKSLRLLQHFKGWVIETSTPSFDPLKATMMDFRVHQQHGTTFAYVLPFSTTKALVEYTLFTKELLLPEQYDAELKEYLRTYLHIDSYTISDEEFGIIPMTNEQLVFNGNGWQIGTAGGQTKASSGYTFQFIQKQSEQIVQQLIAGKPLAQLPRTPKRFRFYDNTLLHILYHDKVPGRKIFTRLFQKNKPQRVLRFLDNESSLGEELKIISSLPTWPFFKAAIRQL